MKKNIASEFLIFALALAGSFASVSSAVARIAPADLPSIRLAHLSVPAHHNIAAASAPQAPLLDLHMFDDGFGAAVGRIHTLAAQMSKTIALASVPLSFPRMNAAAVLAAGGQPKKISGQGMVAVADQADHAGLVARIKQEFSDDVDVVFDPSGDSGVIKPVFKDASADAQSYAFVMVPINQ